MNSFAHLILSAAMSATVLLSGIGACTHDPSTPPGQRSDVSNASTEPQSELDALWAETSRVVAEGDFDGYGALFHPEAVLVNGIRGTSYPIATALAGWKQGFDDTREGRMVASVEFRFSERLIGETTAHETGIFRYAWGEPGTPVDSLQASLIHFQALTVRKEGRWRMVMEYQIAIASPEEWESLEER